MKWANAVNQIINKIEVGTNLNTNNSNYRFVSDVPPIDSGSNDLEKELCYRVIYNKYKHKLSISINMLENIFKDTIENKGIYNRAIFKKNHKKNLVHGCNVHIVGMIFVKAGIAKAIDSRNYKFSL
jgi:hypothetical protein